MYCINNNLTQRANKNVHVHQCPHLTSPIERNNATSLMHQSALKKDARFLFVTENRAE